MGGSGRVILRKRNIHHRERHSTYVFSRFLSIFPTEIWLGFGDEAGSRATRCIVEKRQNSFFLLSVEMIN